MTFKCPLCDYKTNKFGYLRAHFMRNHSSKICPACGKIVKKSMARHAGRIAQSKYYSDKAKREHMILYALTKTWPRGDFYRMCRDYAIKVLEVEEE